MWLGPVSDRAIISLPGVVWRSCAFRPGPVAGADLPLAVDLPEDLSRAVDKRQSEYLAGRVCAGLALQAIGAPPQVGRAGRAPVWPAGISGSISHSGGRAMAVVARGGLLGLDCETVMTAQLAAEISGTVFALADPAWRPVDWDAGRFCTLVFSAKEAAYKALSAQLADLPDFREAALAGLTATTLMLEFRGRVLTVHYRFDGTDCVTLVRSG